MKLIKVNPNYMIDIKAKISISQYFKLDNNGKKRCEVVIDYPNDDDVTFYGIEAEELWDYLGGQAEELPNVCNKKIE